MPAGYLSLKNLRLDMKQLLKEFIRQSITRDKWEKVALSRVHPGGRLLDAGAGQQRYRSYWAHLCYVNQNFCEYDGTSNNRALQAGI